MTTGNKQSGTLTLQEKIADNIWDHLSQIFPILKSARKGQWSWLNNGRCKYIDLRIDMRTGHCILSDKDGTRINPEDFAKQTYDSGGLPWKWPVRPSRVQEYLDKTREAIEEAGAVNDLPTGDWNTRYIDALAKRGLGLMIPSDCFTVNHNLYPEGKPVTAPWPTSDNQGLWPKNTVIVWINEFQQPDSFGTLPEKTRV